MRSERSLTLDVDNKIVEARLITGMGKMRFRRVSGGLLRFERGSIMGWVLGQSPYYYRTIVEFRLEEAAINKSTLQISYTVLSSLFAMIDPAAYDPHGAFNPLHQEFWNTEVELIEAIAKGDTALTFDSYDAIVRGLDNRTFIAYAMIVAVSVIGIGILIFSETNFGLLTTYPELRYILLVFGGLLIVGLIPLIYTKRPK